MLDAAGNELLNFVGESVLNNDTFPPVLTVTSVSPSDGNTAKIGDEIVVTLSAAHNEAGLIAVGTQRINGQTATFADIGSGDYTFTITVAENSGDVPDGDPLSVRFALRDVNNNPSDIITSLNATFAPAIDATRPRVSVLSVDPASGDTANIGQTITVTVRSNPSENNLSIVGTPTIAGLAAAVFTNNNDGTYDITLSAPLAQGAATLSQRASLPINILFQDESGNEASAALTSVRGDSSPAIDTTPPGFESAQIVAPNLIHLVFNDTITSNNPSVSDFTLTGSPAGLSIGSITRVNPTTLAINTVGTNFTDAHTATIQYTQGTGTITDANDNPITTFGTSPQPITNTLDTTGPTITLESVSPGDGNTLNIGDTITVTVTAANGERRLDQAPGSTINGEPITRFREVGTAGTYEFRSTVREGNTDVLDSSGAITVNINLQDAAGNLGTNPITTIPAGTAPGIDANRPTLDSAIIVTTTSLRVTFSEDIADSTVRASDFRLNVSGTTISGVEVDDNIVTLTLNNPLPFDAMVRVTQAGSVSDTAGNAISGRPAIDAINGITPSFTATRVATNTIVLTFNGPISITGLPNAENTWTVSTGTVTGWVNPANAPTIRITYTGDTTTNSTPLVTFVSTSPNIRNIVGCYVGNWYKCYCY